LFFCRKNENCPEIFSFVLQKFSIQRKHVAKITAEKRLTVFLTKTVFADI